MKIRIYALVAVMSLIASSFAFAETKLSDRYSDASLIRIMKDDGYSSVKLVKAGKIRIKVDGRSYLLFNTSSGDLQLYYGLGGAVISYKTINEWNRDKRFSRAYLDSDIDPVLEADLLANGGLTDENVTSFFSVFKSSVRAFRDFVKKNNEG